jgi:Flp pilus assembly secretin CpaC
VGTPYYYPFKRSFEAKISKLVREHVPTANVRVEVLQAPIIASSCRFAVILEGTVLNAEDVWIILELVGAGMPDVRMPPGPPTRGCAMSRSSISVNNRLNLAPTPSIQIDVTAISIKRSEYWCVDAKCVSKHDYYSGSALACAKNGLGGGSTVQVSTIDEPWVCVTAGDTTHFRAAVSALQARGLARTTAIRRAVTRSGGSVSLGDGLYLNLEAIVMGSKICLWGTGTAMVEVESGQSVAIGGRFQRTTAKNVPLIEIRDAVDGGKAAYDETDEELVLLITPRIVEQK